MSLAVDLLKAARQRRCLIAKLEQSHREFRVLSDKKFPGYLDRLDRAFQVFADVGEFNRAFPRLAIPKMVDGKVPVPEIGPPIADTLRPLQT